jgi:hypothetical protein
MTQKDLEFVATDLNKRLNISMTDALKIALEMERNDIFSKAFGTDTDVPFLESISNNLGELAGCVESMDVTLGQMGSK